MNSTRNKTVNLCSAEIHRLQGLVRISANESSEITMEAGAELGAHFVRPVSAALSDATHRPASADPAFSQDQTLPIHHSKEWPLVEAPSFDL